MRILLTNHTLGERAGSELYVRDVALALLARGHEPIAYSRHLGGVARELRKATVPVLDDLDALRRPPDLIHAQHHLETMTALTRLPHTPAVYVCHGWLPDEEAPPWHPRIRLYVAVDELVRQRLVDECGIPENRVRTLLNFVDVERFRPRPPLPERPARALAFNNEMSDENVLPALREACRKAGLGLHAAGRACGNRSACPEELLGRYDVVFAKGRSALEAAAVGAATILCSASGLGPMVTSDELDRQRSFNFGVRLLRRPVTVENTLREIERYDARDAAAVSRRLRREADLETVVDRLLDLYGEVLSAERETSPCEDEEARAAARYLRRGPLTAGDFFQSERIRLHAEAARADESIRELRRRLTSTLDDRAAIEAKWQASEDERQRLTSELAEARHQSEVQRTRADNLAQDVMDKRRELDWITGSATWRWRGRLVAQRWLAAAYRTFFVRKSSP